ncbi:MAG: helix-turn-helix domain-containing protein [Acidobacteriota bacterium]
MKVLIVDPNPESRDALRRAFGSLDCPVRSFSGLTEGVRALTDFDPEIVVASLDAGDASAEAFLAQARAGDPRRITYALVDQPQLDLAVRAVAAGARDFLWRPISQERVAQIVSAARVRRDRDGAAEHARLRLARAELRDALPGRSPRWVAALAALEHAAAAAAGTTVLITGETGTEKDDAALALHRLSARGAERFAYISEGESLDLATRQTESGTLFLSNVEATSAGFQEMLLAHIRGPRLIRFIVSIDEDPRDALDAGRLLRPLHEALAENTVHLPPLRERAGDVSLLARRFLEDLDPALSLDADAADALQAHDWPGNTHELKEVVRRAARLSESLIGPTVVRSVLGRPLPRARNRRRKAPVVRIAVGDSLADVERRLISKTLEFARGNKRKTAELLKLSLKTIYNKIKEYGLEH